MSFWCELSHINYLFPVCKLHLQNIHVVVMARNCYFFKNIWFIKLYNTKATENQTNINASHQSVTILINQSVSSKHSNPNFTKLCIFNPHITKSVTMQPSRVAQWECFTQMGICLASSSTRFKCSACNAIQFWAITSGMCQVSSGCSCVSNKCGYLRRDCICVCRDM